MKIFVAEEAGFCFGVKRALKLIDQLLKEGKRIQTFGPLIHNQAVLKRLSQKGVQTIGSLNAHQPQKTLVIRTHGIPRTTEKRLQRRRSECLDATCPLVKRIHRIIEKLAARSAQVIIVGDRNHPEIAAAKSYARRVTVVSSIAEARALPRTSSASVVAQTTLDGELFKSIISILMEKTEKLEVFNTICEATKVRQRAAAKLAAAVDCMLVIGSRNSSNTCKLVDIAKDRNRNTIHIENPNDLKKSRLLKRLKTFNRIGITAGASTPPEEIVQVKKLLQQVTIEKEKRHGG